MFTSAPALTHLVVDGLYSCTIVWAALCHCTGLAHLDIALYEPLDDPTSVPIFPLRLPVLRKLVLRYFGESLMSAWSEHLTMPRLESLDLQDASVELVPAVIRGMPSTLIDLSYSIMGTLIGPVDAGYLSVLGNLRSVCIKDASPAFLQYLREHDVWPKLESLHLRYGSFCDEEEEALLDLVRSRSERAETATLKRVVFDGADQQLWLTNLIDLYTLPVRES
ncbi:hypothetical protein AURDEDRAFT_176585 [Auricularia subglabra TFB-10046 SS5]|uniref:F-box domain-containing protein n=1 Tax=Auricularia subglabra (strain TFB-10046 / SS5) TaxID=717982 RepID=J0D687_AURST|nr:hypothetical protein AURDEDRAFT_176585 [Auricularia subglabra TFB-10046 SS5]